MQLLKLFIISSVITLLILFLYFLYQTNTIKHENNALNDYYNDTPYDSNELKCPKGYYYSGVRDGKDVCKLNMNLECNKKSANDCNGYCKLESITTDGSTTNVCSDREEILYQNLDLDKIPELNRNTILSSSFEERCEGTTHIPKATELNWSAITPYCDQISYTKKN